MSASRIYNALLLDAYLKLIRANYPHVNLDHLLQSAGIESYEIADQGSWFTQEQVNRFYALAVQATGNDNIAREAGRYAASPDALGSIRQVALALLGPSKAFDLIGNLSKNLTKSSDYLTRRLDAKTVEVIVRPRPGVSEEPFQCLNRIGFFEAIVSVFNYKMPQIEHEECLFRDGSECRYTIRWQPSSTASIKRLRDYFTIGAAGANAGAALLEPSLLGYLLPGSLIGVLGLSWWLEASRKWLSENTLNQLRDSSEKLTEQINVNYRNIQLTREIGEVVTSQNNIDDVIGSVIQILEKTLDYDRGLILLANETIQRLEIRGGFGYSTEHLDLLENTSFRLDNPDSQGPFVVCFRQKKPLLINDANEICDRLTPKSSKFIKALGTRSFLTVPIILENESIGIIAVDNQQRKKPLINSDVNLLMSIAPTIGISFRNAALNEARENQFAATLKVLAHSIDARDFLTAGHSEKVAEYATGIALELGMSHDYCQMIRVAALLHDYGKIGIPDTILKKDGPLTEDERAMIRTHSEKSRDILQQVPFDGLFQEIPLIALYHHERWDGTGYPTGLSGEAIPLGARIVAVADFFEAITAKRHYRQPMPLNVALNLLKEESGAHFDPHIVRVFLRCLERQKDPEGGDQPGTGIKDKILPQLRAPRYGYQAPVVAEIADLVVHGETVDISSGGAFLHLERSLAEKIGRNALIKLEINLPHIKGVKLEGQVRWVNQCDSRLSQRHPVGIGVAFQNINQHTQKLINTAIRKLVRSKTPAIHPQNLVGRAG